MKAVALMQSTICTSTRYSIWGNGSWCSVYYFSNIKVVQQLPKKFMKGLNYLQICHPSSVSNSIQCSDIPLPICNYPTCNLLLHFKPKRKKKSHVHYECQLKHQSKTSVLEKRKPDLFSLAATGDREEESRVSGGSYIKTFLLANGNMPHGPWIFAPN